MDLVIRRVAPWEALDSRGNPTVGCVVEVDGGWTGRAIIPSGASTGRHEVPELRDGEPRMGGRGVRSAIHHIRSRLAPELVDVSFESSLALDRLLRRLSRDEAGDPTAANATLAVSVAAALAAASQEGLQFWEHLLASPTPTLPMPMIQILAGGVHASRTIDLQDVLVIPVAAHTFTEAIDWAWRVRDAVNTLAEESHAAKRLPTGDEGGLALSFPTNRAAVEFVALAIERSRLAGKVFIAIDVAASSLSSGAGEINLSVEDRRLSADEWIAELRSWAATLPIISVEDPLGEDDWEGWGRARLALDIQLVGDDLYATDSERVARGIRDGSTTAVLVKPNQRGTLAEALDVCRVARASAMDIVISARSGESEDWWLADLAIGARAGQIKVGSLARSERTSKWNRLLEIDQTTDGPVQLARPFARRPLSRPVNSELRGERDLRS